MAAVAFGLIVAGVPFPIIIAVAALAGYLAGKRNPRLLGKPGGHGSDEESTEATPLDSGLRRRFVKTLAIWLVPVALLLLAGGFVAQLAGFFTVAALITFGGAYAVLPFVASAAVNHYGWLTSKDMVAGLALGESTPGPADHGQHVRRLRRRLQRRGRTRLGACRRHHRHPLHLRPLVRVHHQRRSDHRPGPPRPAPSPTPSTASPSPSSA